MSDQDIIDTIAVTLSWQFANTEMSDCLKAAGAISTALRELARQWIIPDDVSHAEATND